MAALSKVGRIGVWGRSGSGKSSWVKRYIAKRRRLVVFDPLAEYGAAGLKVIRHDCPAALDDVRQAMRADWAGFRLAYVPPAGAEPQALSALCRLLMAAQQPFFQSGRGRPITLVVEEMNLAFPVSGGVEKCPGFAEICSRGRHYGIEVVGVSQRIAEVNTRFRGNCTETVCFAQKGPRDHKAAAAEIGGHEDALRGLQSLHYLHEKNGTVTAGKVRF